jgi:hypothetical protein
LFFSFQVFLWMGNNFPQVLRLERLNAMLAEGGGLLDLPFSSLQKSAQIARVR